MSNIRSICVSPNLFVIVIIILMAFAGCSRTENMTTGVTPTGDPMPQIFWGTTELELEAMPVLEELENFHSCKVTPHADSSGPSGVHNEPRFAGCARQQGNILLLSR